MRRWVYRLILSAEVVLIVVMFVAYLAFMAWVLAGWQALGLRTE